MPKKRTVRRTARKAIAKRSYRFGGNYYGGGGSGAITELDFITQKYKSTGCNLLHILLDREISKEMAPRYFKLLRYLLFDAQPGANYE